MTKGTGSINIEGRKKEYYLYDHTGRVLMIYNMNTNSVKSANLFGTDMIGRIDFTNGNERLYYIKDHLGSMRVTISNI